MDWTALGVSLWLAAGTVAVLLPFGVWAGHTLAVRRFRGKAIVEALVAIPLVLPPTVLGFYLLLLLGNQGPFAPLLAALDLQLVFTFPGLVIGSMIFSLPFVVYPLRNAFAEIPEGQLEVAATLGAGALDRFASIAVPLAWSGFLAAIVLGFAHTLGEFGVVLMVGGNIPGETEVLSIAIYNLVEQLEYSRAHVFSAILVLFSFVVLLAMYVLGHRRRQRYP
jgi:molybdate transport system permease protein